MDQTVPANQVNVTRLIDEGPLTRFQIGTIVCCALVSALDGIDTQSIGVAAPFIADGLGFKVADFGPIFSAALLGATLGAASFGPLADFLGRKTLLIIAVVLFGVFTILTALANSVPVLLLFRLLAGLGLGGATPCFIALTSEYAPARLRATLVTLMWSAFPLGAMMGGLLNSYIITQMGWRAIFYIGGVAPLVLALVLFFYLPESIKFLLVRRNDNDAVRRIVARFRFPQVRDGAHFVVEEKRLPGASIRHLFTEGRALGTLLLWVPFFMGFGILTVAVLWTPALLRLNGISPANTAFVVAFNGLGGFIGQSTAGRLIERFGIGPVIDSCFRARSRGNRRSRLRRIFGRAGGDLHRTDRAFHGVRNRRRNRTFGADLSDVDPLDRHRLGHGDGSVRPDSRPLARRNFAQRQLDCGSHHDCHRPWRTDRRGIRCSLQGLVRP